MNTNLRLYFHRVPNIYKTTTIIINQQQTSYYLSWIKDIFNLSSTLQLVNNLSNYLTFQMRCQLSSYLKLVTTFYHYVYGIIIDSINNHSSVFNSILYIITLVLHQFLQTVNIKHAIFIGMQYFSTLLRQTITTRRKLQCYLSLHLFHNFITNIYIVIIQILYILYSMI